MEMDSAATNLEYAAQVVNEQFARREREAALDLIRSSFALLPWELQELYQGVAELYRKGKREESSRLFQEWLDQARDMGLV